MSEQADTNAEPEVLMPGTPEWLEARRKGIGGSDAAAIVGLSPWRTPLEVYLDKIGESQDIETIDMRRGRLLEPVVRQMYADETGRTVVTPNTIITNPNLPFALANLDGIASGGRVLECKTARFRSGWGEPGSPDIPVPYLCQVQHCMMVADLPCADVPVLFGDFDFAIYHVPADAEFQALLAECEEGFWASVIQRIPPDPVDAADIQRRWPRNLVDAVVASETDLEAARLLAAIKGQLKLLEGYKGKAEAMLKGSIKDADGLSIDGDTLCTWKSAKPSMRFDAARFRADHPKLYDQYLAEGAPQRRFLPKGNLRCLMTTEPMLPPLPTLPLLETVED